MNRNKEFWNNKAQKQKNDYLCSVFKCIKIRRMTYTIEKITTLLGACRLGETAAQIGFILTDSRSLCFPEETLFFALKSVRNDGHHYIAELYLRGVRNFVVENIPQNVLEDYPESNFLQVDNTLKALQKLAECHRNLFHIPIIGITGSNGKTVVKEWLYQILSPRISITRSPRSYNSQIGVPLSIWLMNENTELGIFEAGISKKGEMQNLQTMIRPTIAVMTNIGLAHQENFASLEEKCREKLHLLTDAQTFVYNEDDELIAHVVQTSKLKGESLSWSKCHPQAAFFVQSIEKLSVQSIISYCYQGENAQYTLPFIDEASIENSIICATIVRHWGLSAEEMAERMATLEPVAMRLEVKEGRHGCTLINDSYNSDIKSLDIALDFMNRRPDHKERTRTLILSDILQSGERPEELYREVSYMVEQRGVEKFIGIGQQLFNHQDYIKVKNKAFFRNVKELIGSELFRSFRNEVILLKGARNFGFDQLTEQMVQKVHETILEVNLNALVDNLNYYKSLMKKDTKLVCMIKADGYGAGAVEIAKTLQDHRVDYLAVAVADEGATLRKNGITQNIMVMNPELTAFKTLFDYDLEPEVYSFRLLNHLLDAAKKEGISGFPVHIKLDTGMHRLGFDPENDMEKLIEMLGNQSYIIPRSVFSHFVGSDSDDFDEFSAHQFALFDRASRQLQTAFSHKILRHIDNSAGIEHFPERQLDMCRLGLGLYGINPRTNALMHNVCTLKTTILQKRKVKAGDTVGYSRRGVVEKDSYIAAIPIGYADGLDRHLGNGNGYCLVNGQKAPYIGNICMDVALIDVTGIDCEEGSKVEIFGNQLPITALSDALNTIPYEVLTGISSRVNKVYYQD